MFIAFIAIFSRFWQDINTSLTVSPSEAPLLYIYIISRYSLISGGPYACIFLVSVNLVRAVPIPYLLMLGMDRIYNLTIFRYTTVKKATNLCII